MSVYREVVDTEHRCPACHAPGLCCVLDADRYECVACDWSGTLAAVLYAGTCAHERFSTVDEHCPEPPQSWIQTCADCGAERRLVAGEPWGPWGDPDP